MKRLSIFSLVTFVTLILMVSCKKYEAKSADLKNETDSLNYALGLANGDGIKNYYMAEVEDEDAAIKEFIEALDKAFKEGANADELYEIGLKIGNSFKQQQEKGLFEEADLKFDYKLVKQGMDDGMAGTGGAMTADEAQTYLQTAMMEIQEKKMKAMQPTEEAGDLEIEDLEEVVVE